MSRCHAVTMRITVTLATDTEGVVRRIMAERGVSFDKALNEAIRAGARKAARAKAFRTAVHHLGEPSVPLDHALGLAADLEDQKRVEKARSGT